eukprot:8810328-Ditylum_brightwellii.AAC.3
MGDYHTKHHPGAHHQCIHPTYLHVEKQWLMSLNSTAQVDCKGVLRLMESRPLGLSTSMTSQPVMTQAEAMSHMMTSAMSNQSSLAIE